MTTNHISQIVEALRRGNLALFIGADLPREITGLPMRAELARGLAQRHGLDSSLPLADVAQRVGSRFEVVDYLRRELDLAGKSSQVLHRRLVELAQKHGAKTIITTAYDSLLALAFEQAGAGRNGVVRDSDLRFANPAYPTLIWLYGKVEQVDSLVITEQDHWNLLDDRDRREMLAEVKRTLSQNTVLFLGYDLSDADFRFLFNQVAGSRFARTHYAVWPGLSDDEVRIWRERGIVILDAGPVAALDSLLGMTTPPKQGPYVTGISGVPTVQPATSLFEVPSIDPDNPPIAAIRDLLKAAFTAKALRRFCADRPAFRPIVAEFSPGDGVADMTDKLIEYCWTNLLWDELLAEVQQENPAQYARFGMRLLDGVAPASATTPLVERNRRLEAAMPQESQVGRQTEIRVMVALPDSKGLRRFLPDSTDRGDLIGKEDVVENEVPIEFPVDLKTHKPLPTGMFVRVTAAGFNIDEAVKQIRVSPNSDSGTITFFLTPYERQESARALVELFRDEKLRTLVGSLTLRTEVKSKHAKLVEAVWMIATFPFTAVVAAGAQRPSPPQPVVTEAKHPQISNGVRPEGTVPSATLTWLHLSDLHFSPKNAYDGNVVLRALHADLTERIEKDGLRPDFIAVTGDIAFGGKPGEYEMARAFFDDLLVECGVGKDRLFIVPGNHDVDRDLISPLIQAAGDMLKDRASANDVLSNPGDRRSMFARFKGYARFTKGYLAGPQVFSDSRYSFVRTLDLAGYQIALLGLTSAWLARGGDEDRSCLVIGERQARAALEQAGSADLKIALLHHPFDWLRDFDRDDSATLLTDRCDFILHGHMHQVGLLQAHGPDSNAMIIAAGACYDSREHPNSYNLVRLDLGAGRGTVHLRTYSDKRGGFWTKDVMNYQGVPDGVYAFTLPARSPDRT